MCGTLAIQFEGGTAKVEREDGKRGLTEFIGIGIGTRTPHSPALQLVMVVVVPNLISIYGTLGADEAERTMFGMGRMYGQELEIMLMCHLPCCYCCFVLFCVVAF